jgi:hypothetical protein
MKQTAVEWLVEQLVNQEGIDFIPKIFINQAIKMEKEQIIDSFDEGCFDTNSWRAEQYYNETYNK